MDDFAGVLKPAEDGRATTAPRVERGDGSSPAGSARGSDRDDDADEARAPEAATPRAETGAALGEGSGRDAGRTSVFGAASGSRDPLAASATGCSRVVGGTLLDTGALFGSLAVSNASACPHDTHAAVPSTA